MDVQSRNSSERTPLIQEFSCELPKKKLVMLLAALYSGALLAAMDSTIVATLMGHIANDLQQLDNISWVATGYTVSYSAFQPLYGKLSDTVGRKKVCVTCTLTFALGCAMCGISGGLSVLVAGRFVSGIGAGGMLSMSTVTVSDYIPLRKRGLFQGISTVAFACGSAAGGIFGSWFTYLGGWRLAFIAQVPLILICALAEFFAVVDKEVKGDSERSSLQRIDFIGSITSVSALLLLMVGTTTGGNQFSWTSAPILLCFLVSAFLFGCFVVWESKMASDPIMPMNILCHRTIWSACMTNFFGCAMTFAFIYYGPLFLQALYNYSYTTISYRLVANFVGLALGSLGSGIYIRHTGRYWWLGIWSSMVGLISGVFFLFGTSLSFDKLNIWYQEVAFFLQGAGYCSMLTITLIALISAVPSDFQAITTAAQYTFRGAGSSMGISAAAAVMQNVLVVRLKAKLPDTEEAKRIISEVSKSIEAIREIPSEYVPEVLASYRETEIAVFSLLFTLGLASVIMSTLQGEHDLESKSNFRQEIESLAEQALDEPAVDT